MLHRIENEYEWNIPKWVLMNLIDQFNSQAAIPYLDLGLLRLFKSLNLSIKSLTYLTASCSFIYPFGWIPELFHPVWLFEAAFSTFFFSFWGAFFSWALALLKFCPVEAFLLVVVAVFLALTVLVLTLDLVWLAGSFLVFCWIRERLAAGACLRRSLAFIVPLELLRFLEPLLWLSFLSSISSMLLLIFL